MTASIYIYRNIFYRLSRLEILNTIRYSWLIWTREERWSSDNRVVILTLIIHWLGPLLSLPRCSTAMLVYSGRLAKCPDQESNLSGSETRTCNPVIATRGFLPIELSYPCTENVRLKDYVNREIRQVPFILISVTWYELSLTEETTQKNWGILPEGRFPRLENTYQSQSIGDWINQHCRNIISLSVSTSKHLWHWTRMADSWCSCWALSMLMEGSIILQSSLSWWYIWILYAQRSSDTAHQRARIRT